MYNFEARKTSALHYQFRNALNRINIHYRIIIIITIKCISFVRTRRRDWTFFIFRGAKKGLGIAAIPTIRLDTKRASRSLIFTIFEQKLQLKKKKK